MTTVAWLGGQWFVGATLVPFAAALVALLALPLVSDGATAFFDEPVTGAALAVFALTLSLNSETHRAAATKSKYHVDSCDITEECQRRSSRVKRFGYVWSVVALLYVALIVGFKAGGADPEPTATFLVGLSIGVIALVGSGAAFVATLHSLAPFSEE